MASVVSVDDIESEQSELTATTITKEQDDTEMVDNAHQESSDVAHQESSDAAHQESSDAANKSPKTPSKKPNKSIPYTEVITNAIIALKDRTGSSQQAIQKWIVTNYPCMDPVKLKKRMNFTMKNGVKSKRFVKIKSSFKINPIWLKKKEKPKKKVPTKAALAKVAIEKAKEEKAKAEKLEKVLTKEEIAAQKEKEKEEIAAQKEKERKEKVEKEYKKKERERLDKIRRRKFPMDDLKLIAEDKELRVKVDTPSRPSLELAMPNFPAGCRSDTIGSGIMNDVIHIYHFFRGDVGWGRFNKQKLLVAPFTLEQWMECVQQISKGWSKKARMLPPLMTHLFVVTLQHLVPEKLKPALTPASWSEVLLLYMDAMSSYYTDKLAEENNSIIPSLGIDGKYLFFLSDKLENDSSKLEAPDQSSPYLTGILEKAHSKRFNQDPWNLNAEELLSLLKALVDDVLATSTDCAEELVIRNEETYELLKRKRTADANFRRIQTGRNRQLAEEAKDRKTNGEEEEKVTRSTLKIATISEAKVDKTKKEQQKLTEAYEKIRRSKRIRTEPIGMDKKFQEVHLSWNDPQQVFFLQKGKSIPSDLSFDLPDSKSYRITWQSITQRSTLNKFMDSLDVRGIREQSLHEALQLARRYVHDDIKEMNDKKALLRDKSNVKRRLENARTNYENGRKSGRLAAQSEQELIDLQDEIERLEKSIECGNVVKKYDMELETGLTMLREFDAQDEQTQRRRASRRDEQEDVIAGSSIEKMQCSKMWPTGHIDGTGAIGLMANQLLDLEKRVEMLAGLEKGERKAWISSIETAIYAWNELSTKFLIEDAINDSSSNSPDSDRNSDCASQNSSMSVYQLVCMIRQRLLELENRVFEVTGLAMVAKETDEADDNMSTSPVDEEEKTRVVWKKSINRLKRLTAKDHVKIHTAVVEAIAGARKAQDTVVVGQLKHALLEYHPQAAGLCKTEALKVLEDHGDYEEEDDDEDNDEDENENELEQGDEEQQGVEIKQSGIASCLCAEAIILNSSLDGEEDASRLEWITAVKKTRTVSKMASLVSAFYHKALTKVEKMEEEHSALIDVMGAWDKSTSRKRKSSQVIREPSEVWANVFFSDAFCFVKVEGWPWWPARKCVPKDDDLASKLESLGRILVSLVGERGSLRVVKTNDLSPFSDNFPGEEDQKILTREVRNQLDEAMAIARRVVRGNEKKRVKEKKPPIKSIK